MPSSAPHPTEPAATPLKVAKFGGTSLADAAQIAKAAAIVAADPARRVVVPSAPGKRHDGDAKITDRLYECHNLAALGDDITAVFAPVRERFAQIAKQLDLPDTAWLSDELDVVERNIAAEARAGRGPDYAASRGEYLNGKLLAVLLRRPFIDAADVIRFTAGGKLDAAATYAAVADAVNATPEQAAVIPGFYGAMPDPSGANTSGGGGVRTFSRGGSDITGAIVARALRAAVYENWTDVSGLLMADPRVVDHPATIALLTYRELRELSYMGATVLHPEAVFPVREAGIPVHIRNTNDPDAPGTMIVANTDPGSEHAPKPQAATGSTACGLAGRSSPITGIAGRKDFTVIALEKALMNNEVGYGEKVLGVLRRAGISFEHMPSGIDTMSLVVADSELEGKLDDVIATLQREVEPDTIEVDADLALIATVGRAMKTQPGMAGRLFGALADARVNIRMIDQGSSELNIIVGVNSDDFETAVRAIYAAFIR